MEENIALAREVVRKYFVSDGMIADLAIHQPDKDDIVNISWHIFLKDITIYAANSKLS